jgi:hypothetical protein
MTTPRYHLHELIALADDGITQRDLRTTLGADSPSDMSRKLRELCEEGAIGIHPEDADIERGRRYISLRPPTLADRVASTTPRTSPPPSSAAGRQSACAVAYRPRTCRARASTAASGRRHPEH